MEVIPLIPNPETYSCFPYYLVGDHKLLSDKNTLIDLDSDGTIIRQIEGRISGIGKSAVDQVIFTHQHFDHTGSYVKIKEKYNPTFWGFTKTEKTTNLLEAGMEIEIANTVGKIIHSTIHSNDSVLIYFKKEKLLFSGDSPLNIRIEGGSYPDHYIMLLEELIALPIDIIYPGHDEPYEDVNTLLRRSLSNVLKSHIYKEK